MTTTTTTSRRRGRAIDERTRAVLAAAHINGTHLRLAEQLTPDEYAPVRQILEALGGVWTRGVGALVFPAGTDVAALIGQTLATGRIPLPARTADGCVPTPAALAADLCTYPHHDLAWLPAGARVLEPSAGTGRLVDAILTTNPTVGVTAVEPDPHRAASIDPHDGQVTVVPASLEAFARAADTGERFAAAVMNPPFATPGQPTLWIDHVRLAFDLLAPGARLVGIVPASFAHRTDARHRGRRDLVDQHGGYERLPADAFTAAGTGTATTLLWLTRPVAGDTRAQRCRFRGYTGAEPAVRVAEPRLTGEAAMTAPVQIWYDGWRRHDRILRYRAQCVVCGWLLWGFDDRQDDPRGVLGDFSCGFSLDADEYHPDGRADSVGLCCRCANDHRHHQTGLARAEAIWAGP